MPKVIALTKYSSTGASSRVRFANLVPGLEGLGWEVSWRPLLNNYILETFYKRGSHTYKKFLLAYLKRVVLVSGKNQPDIWWVEKEFFYGVPWRLENLLVQEKLRKSVIDYDDGVFLNYFEESKCLPGRLGKFPSYARNAACITFGSGGIEKHLAGWGCKRLVKVPSTVDVRKYKKHVFLNKKTFTIGWIGTPVTQPMLELLRAPLLRLSKELSFKMVVVGGYWHVTGLNIECVPWSEVTESQVVAEFDVGVMPLRDLEWERCKCGYKLIQYMAAGVVPVGANVGENRAIIRDGETGFLCETEGDWYNTLALLASNPSRCAAIAAAARLAAETKFDLGVAVKLVHQAFKRALEYEADL